MRPDDGVPHLFEDGFPCGALFPQALERAGRRVDLGIAGRVAAIAAGSRGLGRAVAEALAAEGVRLAIGARGVEALEATAAEIRRRRGVEVLAHPVDVGDPNEALAFVRAAEERFGKVDILVTNAGGPPPTRLRDTTPEQWKSALEENLLSCVHLVRAALPGMISRRWGRILAIASVSVKQPVPDIILSNTARSGIAGFMKSLANEAAPHGVLANVLCPGYTRTARLVELADHLAATRGAPVAEVYAAWAADIPMGRVGEPEEFAAAAAFLASERASYITGTVLAVDGGHIRSVT